MKRIEKQTFNECLEMYEACKKTGKLYRFEAWLKDQSSEGKKWRG